METLEVPCRTSPPLGTSSPASRTSATLASTGLKRVVVLLDLDTDEFVFYGTTCADRNTGRDDTARTAKKRGKPGDRLTTLLQHHERKAEQLRNRALAILRMANGNANADTRAGADELFKKAAEERQKALEVRKEINNRGAVTRAAAGELS